MDFCLFIIEFAVFSLFMLSVILFIGSPLNAGYIIAMLNGVFILLPMFLFIIFQPSFLNYGMSALNISSEIYPYTKSQIWIVIICAFWLSGSFAAEKVRIYKNNMHIKIGYEKKISSLKITIVGVFVTLLFIILAENANYSIIELILPSRKRVEDVYGSYYLSRMLVMIPASAGILFALQKRKINLISLFLVLVSLLISAGIGQRRTIITILISFVLSYIFYIQKAEKDNKKCKRKNVIRSIRTKTLLSLGILSLLGPILWFARSYFTQLFSKNITNVVLPWHLRGFFELFFGSTASGFPTVVLTQEMISHTSIPWAYSLKFLLSSPIPRTIWPDKPMAPESLLMSYYDIVTSPSMFIVSDLLLNFYIFAPIVALIFGFIISKFSKFLAKNALFRNDKKITHRKLYCIIYSILLAQTIVMFKNGIVAFFILMLLWSIITIFVYAVTRKYKLRFFPK